jgi:anaerobic ribonucleoside-triphosphate reductase activating protein
VAEDLAAQMIRDARPGTEGITVSGGEPMQQPAELFQFLLAIRKLKPEWSRGMFTGYTERELNEGAYAKRRDSGGIMRASASFEPAVLWLYGIKSELDWIIAGRYNQQAGATTGQQTGSTNQQTLLLTPRYQLADFPKIGVEVRISADGLTTITTGYPPSK